MKLRHDEDYRRALQAANLVLADSNLLALLWKIATGRTLHNVSGLTYLKDLLNDTGFRNSLTTFWIVSSTRAKQRAMDWLRAREIVIDPQNIWAVEPGKDYELLQQIETRRPEHIVIATGAGQEKLGVYQDARDEADGNYLARRHAQMLSRRNRRRGLQSRFSLFAWRGRR